MAPDPEDATLAYTDISWDIAAAAELLPGSALETGFRKLLDALPDTAIDAPRAPVIVSVHLVLYCPYCFWSDVELRAADRIEAALCFVLELRHNK